MLQPWPARAREVAPSRSAISHVPSRRSRIAARRRLGNHACTLWNGGIGMSTVDFKRRVGGIVIAAIALGAFAHAAHAESVYRCRGADGATAFQDRPCADARAQSLVEIAPAPPVQPSPDYGFADARASRVGRSSPPRTSARAPREVVSFACHAADGETFYRHRACPKQIAIAGSGARGRSGKSPQSVGVTAEAMPRADVCRELTRGGSIGRAGHERDESISSYDRNLGRDPCRRL
jgi:uncharacterized protein DUF4124